MKFFCNLNSLQTTSSLPFFLGPSSKSSCTPLTKCEEKERQLAVSIPPNESTSPLGKLRTEFTSPIAKSLSLTVYVCWKGKGSASLPKNIITTSRPTISQVLDPAMLHFMIFHDLYTCMRTDGIRELP